GLINQSYAYPDFQGVDWSGIKAEFAPHINDGTLEDFYRLLGTMIARLKNKHTRFLSPTQILDLVTKRSEGVAGIGVMVGPAKDGLLVLRVAKRGVADQAGIQPGDRIVAANNVPITDTTVLDVQDVAGLIKGADGTTVN